MMSSEEGFINPMRLAIFEDIMSQEPSQNCSTFLTVSDKTIPKSTLSQHLRALREAGVIHGERRGIEVHNTSWCAEIAQRFPGLIRTIVNAQAIQLKHEATKRPSRRAARNE
jgi:DNA-binding transcriptional ArsR family regulator